MGLPRLSEEDRSAVASAAMRVARQLAEDLTFPILDRELWERVSGELRDGFLTVIAEVFPNEEARPAIGVVDADQRGARA